MYIMELETIVGQGRKPLIKKRRRAVKLRVKDKKIAIDKKGFKLPKLTDVNFALVYKQIITELKKLRAKREKPSKSNYRFKQAFKRDVNNIKKLDTNNGAKQLEEANERLIRDTIKYNSEIDEQVLRDILSNAIDPARFYDDLNNYLMKYRSDQKITLQVRIDELTKQQEELDRVKAEQEKKYLEDREMLQKSKRDVVQLAKDRAEQRLRDKYSEKGNEYRDKRQALIDSGVKVRLPKPGEGYDYVSYMKYIDSLMDREDSTIDVDVDHKPKKLHLNRVTDGVGAPDPSPVAPSDLPDADEYLPGYETDETIDLTDDDPLTITGEGRSLLEENESHGQSEDELNSYGEKIPGYIGTCTVDEIVNYSEDLLDSDFKYNSLIVNTLKRSEAGKMGHWVCVIIENDLDRGRFTIMYYDPLGDACPQEVIDQLRNIVVKQPFLYEFKTNLVPTQDEDSTLCGFHCIHLIKVLNNGVSWREATHFDENVIRKGVAFKEYSEL